MAAGVLLYAGFPMLHDAAMRLLDKPAKVGMDWLVGQPAVVERWHGTSGTVRAQGSLWNASGPVDLAAGDTVDVVAYAGMTVTVASPARPDPGGS
jgi:membrane protein implicated in regulation of membrane protease activity